MTFQFRPAVRADVPLLIGIAGPSGSGKTFSALRVARGIAGPQGKVCVIDTEARRALHYADNFQFLHGDLVAPFTPDAYLAAVKAAVAAGANVVVVDSTSHEHEGVGGILEMHEAELQRMAGDDWKKREACKFSAWIKPKAEHRRMVHSLLQLPVHLVFCFRAKDKLALIKNDRGKIEPISMGWQPICSDDFGYEMTAMFVLPPGANGKPDLSAQATKLPEPLRPMINGGDQLGEKLGQALAAWARGTERPAAGVVEPGKSEQRLKSEEWVASQIRHLESITTEEVLLAWTQGYGQHAERLSKAHPDLAEKINAAARAARERTAPPLDWEPGADIGEQAA